MDEAWPRLSELIGQDGEVALIGVPLGAGSVTPGRCDLAPGLLRKTLPRLSRYDLETGKQLGVRVADRGDVQPTERQRRDETEDQDPVWHPSRVPWTSLWGRNGHYCASLPAAFGRFARTVPVMGCAS